MNTIVKIEGELDAASVGQSVAFFEKLAEDAGDVVLDLRGVARLDGSGLGALIHVFKRKSAHGRRMQLANVSGQPRQLLNDLKVLPLLEYAGDATVMEVAQRAALAPRNIPGISGDAAITPR